MMRAYCPLPMIGGNPYRCMSGIGGITCRPCFVDVMARTRRDLEYIAGAMGTEDVSAAMSDIATAIEQLGTDGVAVDASGWD